MTRFLDNQEDKEARQLLREWLGQYHNHAGVRGYLWLTVGLVTALRLGAAGLRVLQKYQGRHRRGAGQGKRLRMEEYLFQKSSTRVSHGCCPECFMKHKDDFA